jgi:hypothetical protein
MFAQAAIAHLGRLIGRKESNFYLLTVQYIGNQRGNPHVPRIKRQIQRLFARLRGMGA